MKLFICYIRFICYVHDTAVKGYLELSFTFEGNLTAKAEINGLVAVSDVF